MSRTCRSLLFGCFTASALLLMGCGDEKGLLDSVSSGGPSGGPSGGDPTGDATDGVTSGATTEAPTTGDTPLTSSGTTGEPGTTTDDSGSDTVTPPTTTTPGPTDSDMDGIDDADDNCPNDANPNQLDFDSNGVGNVCDEMVFSQVSGTLASSAVADAGIGSCNIPMDFVSTGGQAKVLLDDDAAVARVEIAELRVADILDKQCMILIINATVSIKDFAMTNTAGPFPVQVPHTTADHDAGVVSGVTDLPHPVLATGELETSTDPNMQPTPSDLMLDASLPAFAVEVSGGGEEMTLTWDNNDFVVATSEFVAEGLTIEMQIIGLSGSLTLTR